jgi:type III pantothenate kinase
MNFVVDLGNTYGKVGVFEGNNLVERAGKLKDEELIAYLMGHSPENVLISSVRKQDGFIAERLGGHVNCIYLNQDTPLPIKLKYRTPQTLGVDRIAGVVGANYLFPAHDCLVIDIGTCITYDFIDAKANFHGGGISPGIHIKLKALHNFTARLPLVHFKEDFKLIGQTTEESILSGVLNGTLSEIEQMMDRYANKFPGLKVIICGGDAGFFESRIKAHAVVKPDLVLIGLNRILLHNVFKHK